MPNKLLIIRPHTLSLVNSPANKRFFYVTKEDGEMENEFADKFPLPEEYKSAFDPDSMEEGELETAVKESLGIISKWKEDMPTEVEHSMGVLARAVGYGEGIKTEEVDNEEEDTEEDNDEEDQELEIPDGFVEDIGRIAEFLNENPDFGKPENEEEEESEENEENEGEDEEETEVDVEVQGEEGNEDNEPTEPDKEPGLTVAQAEEFIAEQLGMDVDRVRKLVNANSVDDLPEDLQDEIAETVVQAAVSTIEEGDNA